MTLPATAEDLPIQAASYFQENPDCYIEEFHPGIELSFYQKQVCRAVAKPNARVCLVGANGMGKDAICALLVEWFLFCFGVKGNPALVPTTSASGRQIAILWQEVNMWMHQSLNRDDFELLQQKLSVKDTLEESYSLGFKGNDAKTVEGYHAQKLLYILTEARGAPEWMFTAILKACTREDNRVLVQSVPGEETGEFYKIASGIRNAEMGEGWEIIFAPAAEKRDGVYVATTKLVSQQSIDEKLRYGEESSQFVGPVLAKFIKGSSLALVSLGKFMDAWNRHPMDDEGADDVLGIDVSWVGSNESVLTHRKGPVLKRQWAHPGTNTIDLGEIAVQWYHATGGWVIIEHGIAQSGVIDYCRKQKVKKLITVDVGGPALEQERFADRKSELAYYFAERFEKDRISVPDKDSPLCGQLMAIQKKIRGDQVFQLEPKAQTVKRLGGMSPDWADSAILTIAAPNEGRNTVRTDVMWAGGERASAAEGPGIW